MKKKALALTLAFIATLAIAQQNIGVSFTLIADDSNGLTSCTNYIGRARVTENSVATPSVSNAVWNITRIVLDSNGAIAEKKNAYGSGTGDNSLWTTAWTNRVAATYK